MIGGCILFAIGLPGCASISTISVMMPTTASTTSAPQTIASSPPRVSSAPPRARTSDWAADTRQGRAALFALDFEKAEADFLAALDASTAFRSLDVRVDVSFGNIVRLASVYQRIGRLTDAERLMTAVESTAGQRRLEAHKISGLKVRYARLVASSLDPRLEAAVPATRKGSAPYDHLIRSTADSYDVDPALVKAVVAAESNFEARAVSRVGAQGLMQLMPGTARAMGVRRPFAPRENIRGGVRYLRSLLDRFDELDHALAAYNAGPDAVLRYGGIPPYPETEAYVTKVLSHYRRYQRLFSR